VSVELVGAVVGVVAEGNGKAVGAVIGVGLVVGFSCFKVILSPNVPWSLFRDTKHEAGGSVPNVGDDVGLNDTPTDVRFVVVKTVKTFSLIFFFFVSIYMKFVKRPISKLF